MDPRLREALFAGAAAPVSQQGRARWQGDRFVLDDAPGGKRKPNFLQSLLPSAGGLSGGVAGGAAGGALAGTAILPGIGTAAGGLIGALLGGAAGGAAGKVVLNKQLGDSAWHDVGKEAALQGVLSAGPLRLLKGAKAGSAALLAGEEAAGAGRLASALNAAGEKAAEPGIIGRLLGKTAPGAEEAAGQVLKTSGKGKLQTAVNSELAKQYGTISKPIARATKPMDTFGALAKAGLTKPEDVERVASAITGADGILNKAVMKSVGNARGVNTDGLEQIFMDALENHGIVEGDKKSLQAIFKSNLNRLRGGAQGSLDPLSSPDDVLDVMKTLEARASDYLGKGGTSHLATSTDKAKATVLHTLRDELQDRLYQGAGANENIAKVLTPELRQELISLAPGNAKWASHVDNNIMKAGDIGALRSAQSPFVNAGKIIDEGATNALTYGGRVGNSVNSLRGQAFEKTIGAAKKGGARALAGAVNSGGAAGKAISPWGLGQVAGRTLPVGLAGALQSINPPISDSANQMMPNNISSDNMLGESANPNGLSSGILEGEVINPGGDADPFGLGNVDNQVKNILASGGDFKDVKEYLGLVQALQELKSSGGGGLNSTSAGIVSDLENGIANIRGLSSEVQTSNVNGPLSGRLRGLNPYDTGAQSLQADLARIKQVIGKALEGGVLRKEDEDKYARILPTINDTDSTAQYKIQSIADDLQRKLALYKQNLGQGGGGSADLSTLLAAQ